MLGDAIGGVDVTAESEREDDGLFSRLACESKDHLEAAYRELTEICASHPADELFSAVAGLFLLFPGDDVAGAPGTHPIKLDILVQTLRGLPSEERGSDDLVDRAAHRVVELLTLIRDLRVWTDAPSERDPVAFLMHEVREWTLTVRGTAYDDQLHQLIAALQSPFDEWFAEHVGISPSKASECLYAILLIVERRVNRRSGELKEAEQAMDEAWRLAKRTKPKERTREQSALLSEYGPKEDALSAARDLVRAKLGRECLRVSRGDLNALDGCQGTPSFGSSPLLVSGGRWEWLEAPAVGR